MLGSFAWDTSFYGGQYYLYFGITPVLVLFLPFHFLTGLFLPGWVAAAVFCSLGYIFSLLCLLSLWKNHDHRHSKSLGETPLGPLQSSFSAILTALILGMGSFVPFLLQSPMVYEIAEAGGFCFGMLGAFALTRISPPHTSSKSLVWSSIAGLALALAVGSRPGLLVAGIPAISFLLANLFSKRITSTQLVYFLVPYIGYGSLLAVYNYLRFGSWIEFGWHYVLNDYRLLHPVFSLQDLFVNVRDYLFLPPSVHPSFPYVNLRWDWMIPMGWHANPEAPCIGIFWLFPAIPLAIGSFDPRIKIEQNVRILIIGFLFTYLLLLILDSLVAHTARYQIDMAPYLLIPATFMGFTFIDQSCGLKKNLLIVTFAFSAAWGSAITFFASHSGVHGSSSEEIHHFRRVVDSMPNDERATFNLGYALEKQGDLRGAIQQYEKALELSPADERALLNLANALAQSGNLNGAKVQYMKTLALDPNCAEAEYDLGNLMQQTGNLDTAILHYQGALTLQPYLAAAHDNLGNLLLKKGQTDDAITHLQRAVELDPSNAEAHNNLGKGLLMKGRLKDSLIQFQDAARLQPSAPLFQQNLSVIQKLLLEVP